MHPAHLDFAFYRVGSQKTWQWFKSSRYILSSVKGKFTFLLEEQTSHYDPNVHFPENYSVLAPCHMFQPVQFSRSLMSDSLQPHGLQHARLPCPSPTLGACSNSCPSSQWCHPTISSSGIPFSSCLQSFPASGPFPKSQIFTLGGQSTRVSASPSVLPMNIQDINMSRLEPSESGLLWRPFHNFRPHSCLSISKIWYAGFIMY